MHSEGGSPVKCTVEEVLLTESPGREGREAGGAGQGRVS